MLQGRRRIAEPGEEENAGGWRGGADRSSGRGDCLDAMDIQTKKSVDATLSVSHVQKENKKWHKA